MEKYVWRVGAGDAFHAALAMALGERLDLGEANRVALIGGGLCCTKLGVIPALPDRQELDAHR